LNEKYEAEVAYMKLEKWMKKDGLVTKALKKFISAISELMSRNIYNVNFLYANVHSDNTPSLNVLLRSGFTTDDSPPENLWYGTRKKYKINIAFDR
jgi:RimJ/RimL family protein N-acetyltransferase